VIRHPGIVVLRARWRVAECDVGIGRRQPLDELQSANAFIVIGREVDLMASLGEAPQHGFEITEVGEMAPEKQDSHCR
jgi:hypothetical protein